MYLIQCLVLIYNLLHILLQHNKQSFIFRKKYAYCTVIGKNATLIHDVGFGRSFESKAKNCMNTTHTFRSFVFRSGSVSFAPTVLPPPFRTNRFIVSVYMVLYITYS